MNFSMARKFAFRNLKANRILEVPFILSSGLMFILFNIMASLYNNEYVQTRHSSLAMIIGFGIVLTGLFTFIFGVYTTNFLLKRRNKEFALYGVLGLEKRHIRKIISIEFFILFAIVGAMAIVGGYVFGQLTFLILNRLLKDVAGGVMDYPFDFMAMGVTLLLLFAMYVFTVLRSSFRIYLSTPVQLIGKHHSGEGEPKSRFMLMMPGLAALIGGYYIALTTKGILSSLFLFFGAAILVIIATYLLYVSLSVFLLKLQKKRESYYTPTKFLKISGLLHRMKSNAVSLASISILSAGVIVALSVTSTIYSTIENTASNTVPRQYQIESPEHIDQSNYKAVTKELNDTVRSTVDDSSKITNDFSMLKMMAPVVRVNDEFKMYSEKTSGLPNFLLAYDLEGYNARTNSNIQLSDDELLLCVNQNNMADMKNLTIGNRTFKVKNIENIVPSNFAVEVYCVVVKDLDTMEYLSKTLQSAANVKSATYENSPITAAVSWDAKGVSEKSYSDVVKNIADPKGYDISVRAENLKLVYGLNGGFLFLGIVIGLIFLTGTILITYYKQISEGYEDRSKYQTMKKVGLSDKLIKKTSASQIVWMFFAPLAVAAIHCMVASKIVYQLLGLFAVKNFMEYGKFFFIVLAIFFIIYFVIFKITSRAYYKIVQG